MATYVIPLDGDNGHYELDVELGGTVYTLELLWNTRAEHWTLSLSEFQGDYLVAGERLCADWGLLLRQRDTRLPPGKLMLVDMSGAGTDPTQEDLGVRVLLVYDDDE